MPRTAPALFALLLLAPLAAQAQTPVKPAMGNIKTEALRAVATEKGIRLEGSEQKPARVVLPQISVVATTIVFDFDAKDKKKISEVRAQGNVSLKLNVAATATSPKTYVESKSDSATLTLSNRTLQLVGNLSGFYQIGTEGKNTLSGDRANLNFAKDNLTADVQNPVLQIPAETLGRTDALGALKVTAGRGQVSQSKGIATFSGNARVTSSGGPNAFDLAAPAFTITRGTDGTLSTIETQGKTSVKYDLPPDPKAAAGATGTNGVSAPTHVEVTSDTASFDRASGKATFKGNVKGFYRLQTATGPQDFPFSGDQANISFNPQAASTQSGLSVEVLGGPVSIDVPPFDF